MTYFFTKIVFHLGRILHLESNFKGLIFLYLIFFIRKFGSLIIITWLEEYISNIISVEIIFAFLGFFDKFAKKSKFSIKFQKIYFSFQILQKIPTQILQIFATSFSTKTFFFFTKNFKSGLQKNLEISFCVFKVLTRNLDTTWAKPKIIKVSELKILIFDLISVKKSRLKFEFTNDG